MAPREHAFSVLIAIPGRVGIDVEVVRGNVAETSLHPFPFSRPSPSQGSNPHSGPSPTSNRSGPSPTFNRPGPCPVSNWPEPSPTANRVAPLTLSNQADARLLHGDMGIYPVNWPPALRTMIGPASAEGSGSGRKLVDFPVVRTKRLPTSPITSTKPLTSLTTTTRPLPTPTEAPVSPMLSARPTDTRCVWRSTQADSGQTVMHDGCAHRQHARRYGLDGIDGGMVLMDEEAQDVVEDDAKVPVTETEPKVEKKSVERLEVTVEMERGEPVEEVRKEPVASADVEMSLSSRENANEKEKQPIKEPKVEVVKDKVELVEPKPVLAKITTVKGISLLSVWLTPSRSYPQHSRAKLSASASGSDRLPRPMRRLRRAADCQLRASECGSGLDDLGPLISILTFGYSF
ncbi:hypothetical protein RhiJN_11043 [Ceratobasidium sp. AG-Ba]|nr:hypothetical protein RhiJN_11043 [Ceratobasidium sp. AG-Ba]